MADAKITVGAEDRTARVFAGIRANLTGVVGDAGAVGRAFSGLGPLIAGAFTVGGLTSFIRGTVDGIDKLNDVVDASGSTIEKISGIEAIGARTGTSLDTIGTALQKLNQNLLEAQDPTSEAARLFKALGLSVDDLSKLDPSDALLKVSTALAGFADGPEKARFQFALLGKSTRELASFLKDLAEAGQINGTVTEKQAKEAEKFNQQLFQMNAAVTATARSIVSDLVPALTTFFERLNGARAGGGFFASIGKELEANLASDRLRGVVAQIEDIEGAINRQGATPLLTKKLAGLREEAAALIKQSSQASEALKNFAGIADPLKPRGRPANEGGGKYNPPELQLPGGSGGRRGGGAGRSAAIQREVTTEAQRYLETLQRQLQGTQDLSVAETVLADIQAGRLKLAANESREPLLAVAREIDAAKRRADQLKAEADQVRDLTAANKALADEGARVFEATRTPRERLDADLARTRELFGKGAIDTNTYAREVNRLNAEFDKLGEQKEVVQELDTFTVRAAENIQDALGDELTSVLQGNFKNIGDSFKRTLDRMVAEALAADINRAIFGNLGKTAGGGSGGGLFNTLLNFGASLFGGGSGGPGINGGSMLPNSLRGGAATGSNRLERDMITLVHKGEAIVPKQYNPAAGGCGAGMTVVQNINITGPVDARTRSQIAAEAGAGLQRTLARFG